MSELANVGLGVAEQYPWSWWFAVLCIHVITLVAIGVLVANVLSRHSAAASHLAWLGVVVAMLLLVPAKMLVPNVTILVAEQPQATAPLAIEPAATPAPTQAHDFEAEGVQLWDSAPIASDPPFFEAEGSPLSQISLAVEHNELSGAQASFAWLFFAAYAAGVVVSLGRVVVGATRLRRLASHGEVLSEATESLQRACADRIELRLIPDCRTHDEISIPMTFGTLHPQILLPANFETWRVDLQRDSLLHEMSHIARHDCLWSWLSCLAIALYWFHPAVYFAVRRLHRTREDATDDLVLRTGVESIQYASSLLEVTAGGSLRRAVVPAVAMASVLPIEGRLRRILDRSVRRQTPSFCLRIGIASMFVALASIGVQFTRVIAQTPATAPVKAADEIPATRLPTPDGATFYERMNNVTLADGDPAGVLLNVRGTVLDPTGKPVSGATVVLREWSRLRFAAVRVQRPITSRESEIVSDVFARTQTGPDGRYVFNDIRSPEIAASYGNRWGWDAMASIKSGELGWIHVPRVEAGRAESAVLNKDIQLRKSATATGQLLSTDGVPVSGVVLSLSTLGEPDTTESSESSPQNKLDLGASSLQLWVTSDRDGRFRFPAIPADLAAEIWGQHNDHAFPSLRIVTDDKFAPSSSQEAVVPRAPWLTPLVSSPARVFASKKLVIRGVVRSEEGQPLEGFHVRIGSFNSFASTDAEGRFEWPLDESMLRWFTDPNTGESAVRFAVSNTGVHFVPIDTTLPLDNVLAGAEVELTAKEGVRVTGKVLSLDDQSPIVGARVALRQIENPDSTPGRFAGTNEEGIFEFIVPKQRVQLGVFGPLPGYELSSWRSLNEEYSGQTSIHRTIDLTGDDTVDLEPFLVQRAASLRVEVIGGDDQPVMGAVVSATHVVPWGIPSVIPGRPSRMIERELAPIAQTGADGECQLKLVKSDFENGEVRVEKQLGSNIWFGHAYAIAGESKTVTVQLKPSWSVSGRVTVNGQPTPNVEVSLSRRTSSGGNEFSGAMSSKHVAVETTNASGEYTFVVPANENYSVFVVKSPIDGKHDSRGYAPNPYRENDWRVPDIEFTRQTETTAMGTIRGVVRDFNGRPVTLASVMVNQYMDPIHRGTSRLQLPQVRTDDTGRFELKGLKSGKVRLHVYGPNTDDKEAWIASYVIADVGTEDLEIALDQRLTRALPRLESKRVVPAASVPRTDR